MIFENLAKIPFHYFVSALIFCSVIIVSIFFLFKEIKAGKNGIIFGKDPEEKIQKLKIEYEKKIKELSRIAFVSGCEYEKQITSFNETMKDVVEQKAYMLIQETIYDPISEYYNEKFNDKDFENSIDREMISNECKKLEGKVIKKVRSIVELNHLKERRISGTCDAYLTKEMNEYFGGMKSHFNEHVNKLKELSKKECIQIISNHKNEKLFMDKSLSFWNEYLDGQDKIIAYLDPIRLEYNARELQF